MSRPCLALLAASLLSAAALEARADEPARATELRNPAVLATGIGLAIAGGASFLGGVALATWACAEPSPGCGDRVQAGRWLLAGGMAAGLVSVPILLAGGERSPRRQPCPRGELKLGPGHASAHWAF